VRTDFILAALPGPETAQQPSEGRPTVCAVVLAKPDGSTVPLTGLDLHAAAGETVALLGPNGAEKTTTIGLLLGLLSPGHLQVLVYGASLSGGTSLVALCRVCFFAGGPEAGRPSGQESVERARRLGDDVLLAEALLAYLVTIDWASAGPLYAEAFACTERSGDHLINSGLHNNASGHATQPATSPPPGLTWKPRHKPGSKSDTRTRS
jgi:hypothetical protein